MEAQLQRPCDDNSHEDGRGHSDVGGEKKSVLKKVKEKAKKMKETIKRHGHGQHHHHNEEDHQVHGYGASTCDSTVVRSVTLPNNRSHHSPNTSPRSSSKPTNCAVSSEHRSDHHEFGRTENSEAKLKAQQGQDSITGKKMVAGENGASVKEYLCEKLKPGEEDKALSEVITDALQTQPQPQPQPKRERERGKVTVSKEVAERLGMEQENKREGEDAVAAGEESTGDGVAERLQNALTSWLGKSNGIQTAQDSIAHAFVSDAAGGRGPISNDPNHRH